jgi:hypothetical protein
MAEFKESAKDGDKDGAVQDGTEFERPVASKPVPKGAETHPAWFKELVDGTRNVVDQEEPEAVTRMRDV